jgi:FdhE protein
MSRPDWESRIRRAHELAAQYPAAAQVLGFYGEIAAVQKQIYGAVASLRADPAQPLAEQLVAPAIVKWFPALVAVVEKKGPGGLAQAARELRQQGLDRSFFEAQRDGDELDAARRFFIRACQQPLAEHLASSSNAQLSGYTGSLCPLCGDTPQLAVLRAEGDGGKRSLVCSRCSAEWEFRRILCPNCAEEEPTKLPRFSADDFPHIRVEACDTCKRYLKGIDLTLNGLAVPLVDEIAAAPLDLWAAEHGYEKIALNLMGL